MSPVPLDARLALVQRHETLVPDARFRCFVRAPGRIAAGTVVARLVTGRVATGYDVELDTGERLRCWPSALQVEPRLAAPTVTRLPDTAA